MFMMYALEVESDHVSNIQTASAIFPAPNVIDLDSNRMTIVSKDSKKAEASEIEESKVPRTLYVVKMYQLSKFLRVCLPTVHNFPYKFLLKTPLTKVRYISYKQ